jgi:hypothetical protein
MQGPLARARGLAFYEQHNICPAYGFDSPPQHLALYSGQAVIRYEPGN